MNCSRKTKRERERRRFAEKERERKRVRKRKRAKSNILNINWYNFSKRQHVDTSPRVGKKLLFSSLNIFLFVCKSSVNETTVTKPLDYSTTSQISNKFSHVLLHHWKWIQESCRTTKTSTTTTRKHRMINLNTFADVPGGE